MDIATTADKIRTGEISQHGTRHAPDQPQVPAHLRLRALLRRQPRSSRAEETADDANYFAETPAGSVFPTPTGAQAADAASGQASADAGGPYEGLRYNELQQEIRGRNHGRDVEDCLPSSGKREVLIAALVTDDEESARQPVG